ncbi:zinc finger BED domain-containing protein RICESLEEPER 1-like [Pistacia vera]|uniref:zinc finger BED domain-containing protein RICESLEEPER 1-like n=1 Tax=Pistacia vera TaxID=55513 RepID=UPI00126382EA|nr:zinc finger BED domain-containing protein RICESLEEPER 1-like [Pistacia vera]
MVDQELGHLDETRMIIKYWVPSVASRKDDILKVYEDEKEKLLRYFNKLPCRFSVTMEWCGENSDNFWFIAFCFIDDSWELKKKIINLPKYRFDENFYKILKRSLQDWNIDKKICCMIDNTIPFYSGTSEEFSQINNWLSEQGSLPCIGSIFPFSRLLRKLQYNLIWKSTEWKIDIFFKMEKVLKYLKKTSSNEKKFQSAVDKAKSIGKKVASQVVLDPRFKMDIVERWYKEIYGNVVDTHLKIVTDAVTNICNEYAERACNSESSSTWGCGEMLDDMWRQHKDIARSRISSATMIDRPSISLSSCNSTQHKLVEL